ncbi:penicillin-binding protein [Acidicapsa dinghuensis]|uniref:Penicillin-binding protein n=1 Tax=Acidicapsa dinghuensis TaxID=2218256 RepID=A0ABW1EIZ0_9BACT|nr:penicillin-binding protein [Acidicapsa dinghuensis]
MNQTAPFQLRANRPRGSNAASLLPLRFWLICLAMLIWVSLIAVKLFWLQIMRHQEFVEKAQKQQQHTFEVAPRRGVLYDRNLRELAMTVQADSIFAVPSEIDDKTATVHQLAQIVHANPEDSWTTEAQINERVDASRGFAWIARRVKPEVAAKVKALNLKGIYFQKEFERFYPDNQIAAQVLGYVGVDDNGLGGMEQKFDAPLHGKPGRMYAAVDARRRVMGSTEREPEPGANLELTIDENIQFIAEKALDAAMQRTKADNGTVVIQDVHTGQILALAIRPTFNPNDFRHATPALLRDHAVSDVYEPGSTFKLVTYASAIDQHIVKPDDMIDCQGGAITFNGRTIHDDQHDHLGVITVEQALEHSSDVAAVKLALRMGRDNFYNYIRDFGFGARSGLELPGETRGLLRRPDRWGATSIGSIAIGQEIGVTPIQLVSMVSTIANGGVYLPPHILMAEQGKDGKVVGQPTTQLAAEPLHGGEELPDPLPPGAHRVISTMSAAEMRKMMEAVVLYGTGKSAQLNGYSSGGKTGTAQKIDPATHTYSKTMHIASFAGIAPVNSPVIAVAVVLDNPKGGGVSYYGGAASAPVFTQVAQETLEYLGIPHDIDLRPLSASKNLTAKDVEPAQEETGDASELVAAMNDLPADDPLRESISNAKASAKAAKAQKQADAKSDTLHQPTVAEAQSSATTAQPQVVAVSLPVGTDGVKVPSLVGLPIRQVVQQAALAGLNLQVTGRGLVRSQEPAAGSVVAPGSQLTVHCAR